ncbi:hypothetical protein H6G96_21295 [Nostoc sp. FACHB-892]|uniref:hypothetical protein n=1 Tax=Nostoc sp. FACHB-892 TaxID=2692843 RepID=UPI001683E642|nr:hypothetical protein [Nostoc sp. FACHB-892]MBD2728788.1 hypothetical protein [Nostoc sp. FACHB-892]
MKSTLFTELTASEEMNLSGGNWFPSYYNYQKVNVQKNKQEANGGIANSGFNILSKTGSASANGGTNVNVQKN